MLDLNSLPDSLREQIQEAASNVLPVRTPGQAAPTDPVQALIVEIARQSPELFVGMLLDTSRFTGLETVESEETTTDQVVQVHSYGHGTENVVRPMKSTRTIRRQVRFLSEEKSEIRRRT